MDQGGTLTLDNTAINLPDAGISGVAGRVGGSAGLTLDGGSFNFLGNTTFPSNESFGGALMLAGGDSTVSSSNGSGGAALTFNGLIRNANTGTIDFVAPGGSAPIGSALNQITLAASGQMLAGQLTVNASIGDPTNILPYATVTSPTGSVGFATNVAGGVAPLPDSAYTQGLAGAADEANALLNANPGSNGVTDLVVRQTGDDASSVTSSGLGIAALLIDSGAATSITLGGSLILTAGALLTTGSSSVSIKGGQIEVAPQSGTGPTELILNTTAGSSETIDSPIISAGLPATATVTLANNSTQVFAISVTNGGYGYTTPPKVMISGGGGRGAAATAVLNSTGNVTSIDVSDPGSGYASAAGRHDRGARARTGDRYGPCLGR